MTPTNEPRLRLRYDLRAPSFGAAPSALYSAALDQCAWADSRGIGLVSVAEHHGSDDGYLPSPFVFASALAGRTRGMRLRVAALILPLYQALRAAEDAAVLDLSSAGRLELVVGAGYRREEFDMFGVDFADRVALVEEGVATLRQAWSGEPFEFRGRTVRVRPVPAQRPGPPVILGGMSHGAARRAARIGDGFMPGVPGLVDTYRHECSLSSTVPRLYTMGDGPPFLHVTDDPERDVRAIAPHALHEANSYRLWMHDTKLGQFQPITDYSMIKKAYPIVTPEQAVELLQPIWRSGGTITLHPLMGGLSPDLAWASLELFADRVVPALQADPTS